MDRRTIIATAGAITLTVLAGSAAIAANVGILGDTSKAPVGQLSPIVSFETTSTAANAKHSDATPVTTATLPAQVETVYVDEYVPAAPTSGGSSSGPGPVVVPPAAPVAPAAPVSEGDDGAVSTPSGDDSSASDDGSSDDSGDGHESNDSHYEGGEGDD